MAQYNLKFYCAEQIHFVLGAYRDRMWDFKPAMAVVIAFAIEDKPRNKCAKW